jgi:hypothetical protein
MFWTLGAVYTMAWLASPWIVTGLTLSLGTTILKTSTSALVYAGKGTYYLMSGSSGYIADEATSKDDTWVLLDNPTALLDERYPDHIGSYGPTSSNRMRRKRHMSI